MWDVYGCCMQLCGAWVVGCVQVQIQAVSKAAAESMGSDWLKIFEGCILACTISSLQPGCTYRLRVRCANQAGWGSWCMPVELLTAPDVPGAPGAPVIQQAGTVSSHAQHQMHPTTDTACIHCCHMLSSTTRHSRFAAHNLHSCYL